MTDKNAFRQYCVIVRQRNLSFGRIPLEIALGAEFAFRKLQPRASFLKVSYVVSELAVEMWMLIGAMTPFALIEMWLESRRTGRSDKG